MENLRNLSQEIDAKLYHLVENRLSNFRYVYFMQLKPSIVLLQSFTLALCFVQQWGGQVTTLTLELAKTMRSVPLTAHFAKLQG